jgi:hypothetical protein
MSYLLFEVWVEDEIGHQELVETTASKKQALDIANQCLGEGALAVVIYQESETGDPILVDRLEAG